VPGTSMYYLFRLHNATFLVRAQYGTLFLSGLKVIPPDIDDDRAMAKNVIRKMIQLLHPGLIVVDAHSEFHGAADDLGMPCKGRSGQAVTYEVPR